MKKSMKYRQFNYAEAELMITTPFGITKRIAIKYPDKLVPKTRVLLPKSSNTVWKTICGTAYKPLYAFDPYIDDKLRWCWNNGIQFAWRYYE